MRTAIFFSFVVLMAIVAEVVEAGCTPELTRDPTVRQTKAKKYYLFIYFNLGFYSLVYYIKFRRTRFVWGGAERCQTRSVLRRPGTFSEPILYTVQYSINFGYAVKFYFYQPPTLVRFSCVVGVPSCRVVQHYTVYCVKGRKDGFYVS